MSLQGIIVYTFRAVCFAIVVTGIAAIFLIKAKQRKGYGIEKGIALQLFFVFYLAALVQITVVRDWSTFFGFIYESHSAETLQLIPLRTTILEWKGGIWAFIYHVLGNMLWFVPLGYMGSFISKKLENGWMIMLVGAGISLIIEIAQWIFATGVSDIDDIFLNTLGTFTGWLIFNVAVGRKKLSQH